MDALIREVEEELYRQAKPGQVTPNAEAASWRVGRDGDVWLNGPADEPSLVWQRRGGPEFPEPFDPAQDQAVAEIVTEVLRNLRDSRPAG